LNVADSRIDAPDLAQKVINSLYFSLLTGISTETGSQQSASTAILILLGLRAYRDLVTAPGNTFL
jgi:hypothetical protein